jgi:hypothetical protein
MANEIEALLREVGAILDGLGGLQSAVPAGKLCWEKLVATP